MYFDFIGVTDHMLGQELYVDWHTALVKISEIEDKNIRLKISKELIHTDTFLKEHFPM